MQLGQPGPGGGTPSAIFNQCASQSTGKCYVSSCQEQLNMWLNRTLVLDIKSTYLCQSVGESVIDSFRLEIAIASPSFASLFWREVGPCRQNFKHKKIEEEKLLSKNISERKCQMILEGATKWCLTNFADGTFPQERPLQPKVLELLSLSKVLLVKEAEICNDQWIFKMVVLFFIKEIGVLAKIKNLKQFAQVTTFCTICYSCQVSCNPIFLDHRPIRP